MGEGRCSEGQTVLKALWDLASAPVLHAYSPNSECNVEEADRCQRGVTDADGTTIFRAAKDSGSRSVVALLVLFCTLQLDMFFLFVAPFVFPLRLTSAIFGLFILLALIPLYENSRFARRLSRFLCKYALAYFPVTLHVENAEAFDPKESYVFAYEPHSMLPFGIFSLAAEVGFMPLPKVKLLIANGFFFIPFIRHIWTWMGCIPATRKYFRSYLEAGYSCIVIPGGGREIFYMEHDSNSEVAYIKSRKGFVRIAIEMGRPIVPVFCFGQTHLLKWWLGPKIVLKNGKVLAAFYYWGRFGSYIPFRQPIHVVVGKPIAVKKISHPSTDEIDDVHAQFLTALQELFEKYKSRAGYPDLQLKIV